MKVIIIGGGFYGASIALYLKRYNFIKNITIYEKENNLIGRASKINQARIHNGYHYPRSFSTGYRSHNNFEKFLNDWKDCIYDNFVSYYAISKNNSKVNSNQFVRFCEEIGAPIEEVKSDFKYLFSEFHIENIFKVKELVFDSKAMRQKIFNQLADYKIKVALNSNVVRVNQIPNGIIEAGIESKNGGLKKDSADLIFNCSYSGISILDNSFFMKEALLKHELTELVLIDIPESLKNKGITVMDGPFFSILPNPAYKSTSISHVRYTPHREWLDSKDINPYHELFKYKKVSRFNRIIRDSSRYIPCLIESKYKGSLFEIKTVPAKNEIDDGRPILFKKHTYIKNFYSILGAKIDNIYDVFSF